MLRSAGAGVGIWLVLAQVPEARADEARVAVESDDDACVSSERLREEVAARGGRIDPAAPVRLRVRLTRSANGIEIDVSGTNGRGALDDRKLIASDCTEAVDALALLVALSGDDASGPDATPGSVPATPAPITAGPPREGRSEMPPALRPREVYAGVAWTAASFAEGQIGGRLAVGLMGRRTFAPWAEAGVGATLPRTLTAGGGDAHLTWLVARAAIAPIGLALGERGFVSAFFAFETGALLVSGSGPSRVDDRARPWLAAGAGARLRWELGPRVFADLEAGCRIPLFRDEFVFVHGGTAYRVPALGVESALMLGMNFP